MQWLQPDTIIPEPYNPQSWNRYSYVKNNPVNYSDPSGHRPCEDGNCEINPLTYRITNDFGWILKGDDWTGKELRTIFATGNKIRNHVDDLTNGKGQEWMDEYLGDITIAHGKNDGELSKAIPTFRGPKIELGKGWLNDGGWESHQLLAHELGHIWDIRQVMQGSVELHKDLGGSGFPWPFRKPGSKVPSWSPKVNNGKGNTGINEYFAEAFSWTIYDNTKTPKGVSNLIDAMITDQASGYGN